MSNWNRSDVFALSGLIVSIVAIIVGIAIPEVRCFVGLQSESCPSSPSPSTHLRQPGTNLISKSTWVDYNPLRNLLAEGKWKEADEETTRAMLQAAKREKEGWLSNEDMDKFSCEDLRIIDQLWLDFSKGKFGFSVQKDIYQNLGGTREYKREVVANFGSAVGWVKEGTEWDLRTEDWIWRWDSITWNLNAPKGHLPSSVARLYSAAGSAGELSERMVSGGNVAIWWLFWLLSRTVNCNL